MAPSLWFSSHVITSVFLCIWAKIVRSKVYYASNQSTSTYSALRAAKLCCEDSLAHENEGSVKANSAQLCHLIQHTSNHLYFTIMRGTWQISVASTVLHSPPVLCLVISPSRTAQRIYPGADTWAPSSHSWPRARVPSTPPTGFPPVTCKCKRVEWDRDWEWEWQDQTPTPLSPSRH